MHNQPNKTADFRVECWTPSPWEGILGGHCSLEAVRCWLYAVSQQPATTNPESSLNSTEFPVQQTGARESLPAWNNVVGLQKDMLGATHILGDYSANLAINPKKLLFAIFYPYNGCCSLKNGLLCCQQKHLSPSSTQHMAVRKLAWRHDLL